MQGRARSTLSPGSWPVAVSQSSRDRHVLKPQSCISLACGVHADPVRVCEVGRIDFREEGENSVLQVEIAN